MELKDRVELENTRKKLAELQELCARYERKPVENPEARRATLRSLKGTICQLQEEITRFEIRERAGTTPER